MITLTIHKTLIAAAILTALSACSQEQTTQADPKTQAPAASTVQASTTHAELVSGVDMAALDTKVRPQDDFYQFANGGW